MKKKYILPIIIFVLAVGIRFYRLPATMTFLEDEGRDMLIVNRILTGRPGLLGPSTSTGNMYLGPLYYYFITPALALSGGNPIGPSVLIAITGAITAVLMYLFVGKWFGRRAGILAALMYAVLPLPVAFTRNSWNPNLVPLISLILIWITDNILNLKKTNLKKYFFWLGLTIGTLVQLHYMVLILFPFLAIIVAYRFRKSPKKILSGALYSTVGAVLVLSPFILFEFRNSFVNTKALISFIKADEINNIRYSLPLSLWKEKISIVGDRLLGSLLGRSALSPDNNSGLISLGFVGIVIAGLLTIKKKLAKRRLLIFSALLVAPLMALGIYQETVHLHYLGFLFPLVYILLAGVTSEATRSVRRIAFLFAIFVIVYSIPTTLGYINSGSTHQLGKAKAVAEFIADDATSAYNVVSADATHSSPFQYFLAISDNPPTNELQETLYVICQDRECSDYDVQTKLLYITGPAHPYIIQYLGHPLFNYFAGERELEWMTHVNQGIFVAKVHITVPE